MSELASAFELAGWREPLVLMPSGGELDCEVRPLAGRAGTDEALAAAKAGDVKLADQLELAWLNAWGPRPTVERLVGEPDDSLGVVAEGLIRAGGGPLIEWSVVKVTCWLCFRRSSKHPRCRDRYCDGSGYDGFGDAWTYYTDPDLHLVDFDG